MLKRIHNSKCDETLSKTTFRLKWIYGMKYSKSKCYLSRLPHQVLCFSMFTLKWPYQLRVKWMAQYFLHTTTVRVKSNIRPIKRRLNVLNELVILITSNDILASSLSSDGHFRLSMGSLVASLFCLTILYWTKRPIHFHAMIFIFISGALLFSDIFVLLSVAVWKVRVSKWWWHCVRICVYVCSFSSAMKFKWDRCNTCAYYHIFFGSFTIVSRLLLLTLLSFLS